MLVGLAIGWCGVVLLSVRELPATWPVEASQQLVYLALAAVSGLVLLVRSGAVQQAFINAHAALVGGNPPLALKPWLYRIARNAALNIARPAPVSSRNG